MKRSSFIYQPLSSSHRCTLSILVWKEKIDPSYWNMYWNLNQEYLIPLLYEYNGKFHVLAKFNIEVTNTNSKIQEGIKFYNFAYRLNVFIPALSTVWLLGISYIQKKSSRLILVPLHKHKWRVGTETKKLENVFLFTASFGMDKR